MYVCVYVCMYVCMYVCVCMYASSALVVMRSETSSTTLEIKPLLAFDKIKRPSFLNDGQNVKKRYISSIS